MPWKDRSNETQSVWSCLAIITLLCAVLFLYLIAGKESKEGKQTAYVTDTGNIRYHAKRVEEGL